ncbi:MAG: hypothetical protein Q8862_12835, partial [Bacteroidota bacterium]|nr:hypothetical protein [Bacteroidota bacterium]
MMIKKKIALLFIILAGIGLVANAVLPHHHHGHLICFNQSHCHPGSGHNDPMEDNSDHDHDCGAGFNDCIVKEYFTMPEDGFNLKCQIFTFIDHDFQKHHYTLLFQNI